MADRPARRSARRGMSSLDMARVVAVLPAVVLLLAFVVLDWSEGRKNVLG